MILEHNGKKPEIDPSVFVASDADIIGDVEILDSASVWFKTVIRADINFVKIGRYTNYQDHSMIHVTKENSTTIGDYVTVGHRALIHACKIGNNCLVGMGSIIMDGAVVGDNCIIGAGSLITQGTKIPSGSLVIGAPAKVKRELTKEEIEAVRKSAKNYYKYSRAYL